MRLRIAKRKEVLMTKKKTDRKGGGARERRMISVRGIRRSEPDLRKLSQALIALALAQAEADAECQKREEDLRAGQPGRDDADPHQDVDVA
jgi:hypothetical protein